MTKKERVTALESLILRLPSLSIIEIKTFIVTHTRKLGINLSLSDPIRLILEKYISSLSSFEDEHYIQLTHLITKEYNRRSPLDYEIF